MRFGRTCVFAAVVAVALAALFHRRTLARSSSGSSAGSRRLRPRGEGRPGPGLGQRREVSPAVKRSRRQPAAGTPRVLLRRHLPALPDYYLAVVYLNTRRQALAETAFADVAKRALIESEGSEIQEGTPAAGEPGDLRALDGRGARASSRRTT